MSIKLSTYALMTLDDAKVLMNNTDNANDDYYTMCINTISSAFNNYCYPDCTHTLISATYTDWMRGRNSIFLRLPVWNVTAVSKVEYRTGKSSWVELPADLHEIDPMGVGIVGYGYSFDRQTEYRVTYTAGWAIDAMPGAIMQAFNLEFQRVAERKGLIQSDSFGGQANMTTTYRNITPETKSVLFPFRKVLIG